MALVEVQQELPKVLVRSQGHGIQMQTGQESGHGDHGAVAGAQSRKLTSRTAIDGGSYNNWRGKSNRPDVQELQEDLEAQKAIAFWSYKAYGKNLWKHRKSLPRKQRKWRQTPTRS